MASLDDWVGSDGAVGYSFSSSEGEDSDGEIMLNPITDIDLPTVRENFRSTDDALTVTAHRLALMGRARKKSWQVHFLSYQLPTPSTSAYCLCFWNFIIEMFLKNLFFILSLIT